jgi:RNA polymerase sigma factor (sigma-70 family)
VAPERIDEHADFTAFAQACQLRLLRSAYLICGDRHLAEDLVQTALVKLALRWRQVRDGQPEAYLRTIVYRDAISWWRRQRREIPVAELPDLQGRDDGTDRAELRGIFAQVGARLGRAGRLRLEHHHRRPQQQLCVT